MREDDIFCWGGCASVALLFCPMLMWVYYISIDFLPCIPAIDTWIYHVNCCSGPGQGLCTGQCCTRRKIKKLYGLHSDSRRKSVWLTALLCLSLGLKNIIFFMHTKLFSVVQNLEALFKAELLVESEVTSLFLWNHLTRNIKFYVNIFITLDQKHMISFLSS